jgi:hypothetical protein
MGQNPGTPVVHIKIAGKWMFIPLKMVLIGIDPYPFFRISDFFRPSRCKSLSSSMAGKSPRQLVIGTSINGGFCPLGPGKLPEGIFHDYQFRSNIPKKNMKSGPIKIKFSWCFHGRF